MVLVLVLVLVLVPPPPPPPPPEGNIAQVLATRAEKEGREV